jgi:hypothetical protein
MRLLGKVFEGSIGAPETTSIWNKDVVYFSKSLIGRSTEVPR